MSFSVVKYNNWLTENIDLITYFKPSEFDIFFAICAKMKDRGSDIVEFTFNELREATNYKANGDQRFYEDIKSVNDKLSKIYYNSDPYHFDDKKTQFQMFSTYRASYADKTLLVSVATPYLFILNDLKSNYTIFDLDEFVELDSKYSKELFRYLKQWRTNGKFIVSIDQLRENFAAPNYKTSLFNKKIIEPSIREITEKGSVKNLNARYVRTRSQGRPIIQYVFTFKKEMAGEIIKKKKERKARLERELQKTLLSKESIEREDALRDRMGGEVEEEPVMDVMEEAEMSEIAAQPFEAPYYEEEATCENTPSVRHIGSVTLPFDYKDTDTENDGFNMFGEDKDEEEDEEVEETEHYNWEEEDIDKFVVDEEPDEYYSDDDHIPSWAAKQPVGVGGGLFADEQDEW